MGRIVEVSGGEEPLGFDGQMKIVDRDGRVIEDLAGLVEQVAEASRGAPPSLRIAVMGCIVNGPGEAKDADLAVVGGKGEGYIFKAGELLRKVAADRIADELAIEIRKMTEQ